MRKLTTKEFISKAKAVHGDKYDYSKSVYVDSRSPVLIVCPVHGAFHQRAAAHLVGYGCNQCAMEYRHRSATKSQLDFLQRARAVHGERYDYSKALYTRATDKICIICPEHGTFWQKAISHIRGGGCPKCVYDRQKSPLLGVGTNNTNQMSNQQSYKIWRGIIERCYSPAFQQRHPAYLGCSICEEWLKFDVFKKWFDENYIEGYCIDKDLLGKGQKLYSPQTCCFIPQIINVALICKNRKAATYPTGVRKVRGHYQARFGANLNLGMFPTIQEAFLAYKNAKEKYVKELAEKYFKEGKINERVYNALMKYEVVD